MFKLFTKTKIIVLLIIIIAVAGGYFYFNRGDKTVYEFTEVKRGDVIQTVSVTGQVKSAENIELAFETSGKTAQVNVNVSDHVESGQVLVTLDSSSLRAQLSQARAAVQAAQAKLDELKIGTRPEEIQIAETAVNNYQRALANAQTGLDATNDGADADLKSVYGGALTAVSKSVTVGMGSLLILTDIQFAHYLNYDSDSTKLATAKGDAVLALLGAYSYDRATKESINVLSGGAKASVAAAQANSSYDNIDKALLDVASALQKIKTALDTVPIGSSLTSTELTNLSTEKAAINTEIITIAGKQQAVDVQKATNRSSIATAESALTTAQNNLNNAQANLILKQAGSTSEQIASQEAQVRQAEANVENILAQIAKTSIYAPTAGTITDVKIKKGEIASSNSPVILMSNSGKFQIEANVSEAEIAKVKLGNGVEITLDALGPGEKFPGKIVKIDPAETIISGVIYYKITSIFDIDDERIKSGMTANLDIKTDEKKGVLYVPYYVIKERGDEKYVQVSGGQSITEKIIETGLEGETMVEVISGLTEGEQVAIEK